MLGSEQAPTIGEWLPGILFFALMAILILHLVVGTGVYLWRRNYKRKQL